MDMRAIEKIEYSTASAVRISLDTAKSEELVVDEMLAIRSEVDAWREKKARLLDEYYASGEWQKDYEADEAGLLPPDLKRGILSQDGL